MAFLTHLLSVECGENDTTYFSRLGQRNPYGSSLSLLEPWLSIYSPLGCSLSEYTWYALKNFSHVESCRYYINRSQMSQFPCYPWTGISHVSKEASQWHGSHYLRHAQVFWSAAKVPNTMKQRLANQLNSWPTESIFV